MQLFESLIAATPLVFVEMMGLLREMEAEFSRTMRSNGLPIGNLVDLFVLLTLFQADEPMKATELASKVGHAPTAFTPVLDRLEKSGLVKRLSHPTDRRAILVAPDSIAICIQPELMEIARTLDERYWEKARVVFGPHEALPTG